MLFEHLPDFLAVVQIKSRKQDLVSVEEVCIIDIGVHIVRVLLNLFAFTFKSSPNPSYAQLSGISTIPRRAIRVTKTQQENKGRMQRNL